MVEAIQFFKNCLNGNAPRICVENPILHGEAVKGIGKKYAQIIHPWQFGSPEKKATCLWLKGLPCLKPTEIVEPSRESVFRMPPHKDRGYRRSITRLGIAKAMAEQWG